MYDIDQALARILASVYGKDVRSAIHDAIYQINEKADDSLDLSQMAFGTDVTDPTSPVGDYKEGKIYFNTDTGIIWKLSGGAWATQGNLKAIDSIDKTSTSGNIDTYTITFNDGSTKSYTVTNGLQGVSITNITKRETVGNVDKYDINLSNGTKTPNGFSISNGISVSNIELDTTVGTRKNYKVKLSDGNYTPNGFTVSDGTSSYVYIRYSSSFDGSGMVVTPTEQTVYIGICVTTQNNAPTDPAVYNWTRFVGQSGSGSGDMLKSEYATTYAGTVDKAVALYDGTEEIAATQLMKKNDYDTNNLAGTVDKATKLIDAVNGIEADTQVLAKLSEDNGKLQYGGKTIDVDIDNDTIVKNELDQLTLGESVTTKLQTVDDNVTDGFLKNKNLSNRGSLFLGQWGGDASFSTSTNRIVNCINFRNGIKVSKGKKYTISAKNLNFATALIVSESGTIVKNMATSWNALPFTFDGEDGYLLFTLRDTNNSTLSLSDDYEIQVEEGETPTSYVKGSMSNTQITEELSSIEWKALATNRGGNEIVTLPSKWKELYCVVDNLYSKQSVLIPKICGIGLYSSSARIYTSSSNDYGALFRLSNTTIALGSSVGDRAEKKDASTWSVFYR